MEERLIDGTDITDEQELALVEHHIDWALRDLRPYVDRAVYLREKMRKES